MTDFGVLNIVSPTWLQDKGTGIKGYFRTLAISIFLCNEMFPKILLIKHAYKTFSSDAGIFCFCSK